MEIVVKSLLEMKDFSAKFLAGLDVSVGKGATVLALYGDLGSGKTTFTQFLAESLEVENHVTSPTFVIMKKYQLPAGDKFKYLIHFDCYRFDKPEEVLILDWEDILADDGNLVVVEWPEKIAPLLPENAIKMEFEFIDETSRRIKTP